MQKGDSVCIKLQSPSTTEQLTKKNRAIFAELFKAARIDRVFLSGHIREDVDSFRENLHFFKDQGYEVALWFYDTVGHSNTIVSAKDLADEPKYQRLVDLDGNSRLNTYCPLDDAHRIFFSEKLAKYAALEPDFIMLDDDFRLSQHGGGVPCCVCPLHMRRLCEECGEELDIPTFKSLAFTGKGNKYRDAWMKVQGESLELFAQAIRDEVDKVNPNVSIAVCSAYCSWDLDGTDPIRITNILAGKNHKYLRLHGAPYWTPLNNKPIEGVCEIGRMFASFCQDEDIEIFSEGDPFRTRFHCPSSYLEIFDAALRADGGHDGILKYMSSYDGMPLYETGFFDRHCRNLDRYDKLAEFFPNGADAGVRVLIKPHLLQDADLSYTPLREQSPYPTAGILLSLNGIPTTYRGEGVCKALFGENARLFDISDFREGAILDGVAAKILTERGIDVGLDSEVEWKNSSIGSICDEVLGHRRTAYGAQARLLLGKPKEEASVVLSTNVGKEKLPLAYKYENAEGQRFLVFAICADALPSKPEYLRSYEMQSALLREIEWLAGKPLPVKTYHAPELYTLCEKGEDFTSVILLNCFHDSVLNPVIELDSEYTRVDFCNCSGRIEGSKVILDGEIPVYDFVAFKTYN